MPIHIRTFEERLVVHFELKAAEFTKYSEEQPSTAIVTAQLAGLYKDLIETFRR